MSKVTLDQVIACPNLPSLPTVAVQVLALTRQPDVPLDELARVVQNDQALSARILKTVNSSFYGLSKPCPSITRALSLLGVSTVKALVLGFSLVDCRSASAARGLDLPAYWRRALYSAAAARRIAPMAGSCDPEEAFLAALMQDIGMHALIHAMGEAYLQIVASAGADHNALPPCERAALGFDHAQAGARLAEHWNLPQRMIDAVRHHHADGLTPLHDDLQRAVALGSAAAAALINRQSAGGDSVSRRRGSIAKGQASIADGVEDGIDGPAAQFDRWALEWLTLGASEAQSLLGTIGEDARELSGLFRIHDDALPCASDLLAQAEEAAIEHQLQLSRERQSLRETNRTLARKAQTDPLTGVGNREQFNAELQRHLEGAAAGLALLMIDADRFKKVNDTHGHPAGDAVLAEIAQRISVVIRDRGVVCRYGGEEFAVIIPGADRRAAVVLAELVRRAITQKPVALDGRSPVHVGVTVSVGVAVLDAVESAGLGGASTATAEALVQWADRALYAAKRDGRNCVRLYGPRPASGAGLEAGARISPAERPAHPPSQPPKRHAA